MPFLVLRKDDMGVFDAVKANVLPRQVMEQSGVVFNRADMCKCPFHQDKTPSMKVKTTDKKYFCFGCGERGDAIDFVAKFYDIAPYDAAMQIADQFGIRYDNSMRSPPKPIRREKSVVQILEEAKTRTFRVLADYLHVLEDWEQRYQPEDMDHIDERYLEAVHNIEFTRYRLDILLYGTETEKQDLIKDVEKELDGYERKIRNHYADQRQSDQNRKRSSEAVH